MSVILKSLLALILVADVLVFLVLAASWIFGFSLGVRIEDTNHFRELSRTEFMTILGTTLIVALVSLALLKRLRANTIHEITRNHRK